MQRRAPPVPMVPSSRLRSGKQLDPVPPTKKDDARALATGSQQGSSCTQHVPALTSVTHPADSAGLPPCGCIKCLEGSCSRSYSSFEQQLQQRLHVVLDGMRYLLARNDDCYQHGAGSPTLESISLPISQSVNAAGSCTWVAEAVMAQSVCHAVQRAF
jgi:hypothetical protein